MHDLSECGRRRGVGGEGEGVGGVQWGEAVA